MASATLPSAMNVPGSASQAPIEKPSAPPIKILPSHLAQGYSYVHPVLLLALCAARFQSLVADPVHELFRDLPWLALLQISYVMLCLPPAGSTQATETGSDGEEKKKAASRSPSSPAMTLRPGKPGYRRKQQTGKHGWAGVGAKLMVWILRSSSSFNAISNTVPQPAFLSLTLTFLLATPILAVLLVLFGAPLTTHNLETVLCAAHMALLSATALVYVHGVDGYVWKEVWGIARPVDAVWGSALGTGLGAWFGAIPVPLDW